MFSSRIERLKVIILLPLEDEDEEAALEFALNAVAIFVLNPKIKVGYFKVAEYRNTQIGRKWKINLSPFRGAICR